jgi:REP element-mobilizing transposase RayT
MPDPKTPLEPGRFYHIYNRGTNRCPIFRETDNYNYFLSLYDKYISPVADTYAWVLMGNHFHFLVRILPPDLSNPSNPEGFKNLQGLKGSTTVAENKTYQHFSNLFNAYSKAFNKRYERTGSLFEHTFRRNLVDDANYLKQVVLYIHNNPVHHGFCSHPAEYPWSSYLSCISLQPGQLKCKSVIGWFDNEADFKLLHDKRFDPVPVENLLGPE